MCNSIGISTEHMCRQTPSKADCQLIQLWEAAAVIRKRRHHVTPLWRENFISLKTVSRFLCPRVASLHLYVHHRREERSRMWGKRGCHLRDMECITIHHWRPDLETVNTRDYQSHLILEWMQIVDFTTNKAFLPQHSLPKPTDGCWCVFCLM